MALHLRVFEDFVEIGLEGPFRFHVAVEHNLPSLLKVRVYETTVVINGQNARHHRLKLVEFLRNYSVHCFALIL